MSETDPRRRGVASDEGAASDGGVDQPFDKIVGRLRGVVERLEAGNLGLEEALAAFEEGVRLSRRGAEILDRAEERVEMLTQSPDGAAVLAPLPKAATGGGGDGAA